MSEVEKDIRFRKRQLEEYNRELRLMERDYINVQSERSKSSIKSNMVSIERRIENLEFRLWKLTK